MFLSPVKRTEIVESAKTLGEISEAILFSNYFKGSNQEVNEDNIILTTDSSFNSWGEIIDIELLEEGEIKTYRLSTKPRLSTTMVDYGKSKDNLSQLIGLM